MSTRNAKISLILALGALLQAACGGGPPSPGSSFGPESRGDDIRIYVTNLNFMDATLWAVTTGTREKLGVVTGKRQAVYTIPWEGYMELRIEIDLLSGPRCMTEPLPVDPGDDVELIIDVEMLNSSLCRWNAQP